MGIQGLIPLLEKSWRMVNVSEFSGCTVAVDAYCWLHKGVYTCAEKLARGDDCDAYVYYCMRFVSMLLAKNIKPILVFDGQHLPAKAETESKRRKTREENRRKAAELMRLDKGREASSLLRRSIDVTHKMALKLIKRCREINVDCIVAPYEADSELAYLNLSGIADIVITEDSDLLLFGCKRVLYKLDQNGGGILIEQEKLHLSMNMRPEQFNLDKFRYMCILSGCDYLPSVSGVGLIKARQFITRTSEPDIYKALLRLGSFMNVKVPFEYRDQFMDADRMFQYQPVYDPLSRQLIPLNEMPDPNVPVLVSKLTDDQVYQLALGNIDPISLEVVDNWDPDIQLTPKNNVKSKIIRACHKSIWSKDYQISTYNHNICTSTPEIVKSNSSILYPKVTIKNVTQTLKTDKSSIIKKKLPVTENDILSTLEEMYTNEKISEENETNSIDKNQAKKSISKKDCEIITKVLTPEIDNIKVEIESPIFKKSAKRKYTVLNTEKQIVSGYFSAQISSSNEVIEEEAEYINPFKCHKNVIPKNENIIEDLNVSLNDTSNIIKENKLQCFIEEKECINPFKCSKKNILKIENINDDLNVFSNSSNIEENKSQCLIKEDKEEESINPFKVRKRILSKNENINDDDLNISLNDSNINKDSKLQCFEDVKVTEIISSCKKIPNTHQNAFSWKSYSNNVANTSNKVYDVKNEKMDSYNSEHNISKNNDIEKIDNDSDVDEGFCSQSVKVLNVSTKTPKRKKRSCPRTGLSKSAGKSSQTLLSKFGFKTNEQLKH